jgi:hypothetical protein
MRNRGNTWVRIVVVKPERIGALRAETNPTGTFENRIALDQHIARAVRKLNGMARDSTSRAVEAAKDVIADRPISDLAGKQSPRVTGGVGGHRRRRWRPMDAGTAHDENG